jgi:hypothetical protein
LSAHDGDRNLYINPQLNFISSTDHKPKTISTAADNSKMIKVFQTNFQDIQPAWGIQTRSNSAESQPSAGGL